MKDTNAIEQALRDKCINEINDVVDNFMSDLQSKIRSKYGEVNYYDFIPPNNGGKSSFHTMGTQQLKGVIFKMISNAHVDSMVKVKSKELIKKLELV
jgi:hypothetical protein